jgi:hypothetical protein
MALNIKDRRTDELAREVAALSEKSITEALRETLERRVIELKAEREKRKADFMAFVAEVQAEFAHAPVLDPRSPKEIMDGLDDDIFDSHR